MKTSILFLATSLSAAMTFSACSPMASSSTPTVPTGLCRSAPCQVGDVSGEQFYGAYAASTVGSCADQANMGFNTMTADSFSAKEDDGFAQIRIDLKMDGSYTGFYVTAQPAFGSANPAASPRAATKLAGQWYLGNDKIVIEGLGIGRQGIAKPGADKSVADKPDDLLFVPMSSAGLDVSNKALVSFKRSVSRINSAGQTVEQVCAAQAPTK